ncbi:MAG: A/G-specific adenine glycosylase [Clostridiales bacterium]|nr:A/G-specific adenine glycosylase [Clostridiales bacterium]
MLRDPAEISSDDGRLLAMNRPLLAWYAANARVLPWREHPEPYRVWISEIMLQQTRVEAVKPYYERFVAELPNPVALAFVSEDRLMKLWEGLGYYSRARNLKKAAQQIVEQYGGEMPADYEKLLALPGIGSYTAGAIASIAFAIPVPAVDGNVLRVISRVTASREDILKASTRKRIEQSLKETMPRECPGQFNQGLMEIGAMVCLPNGRPRCEECPFHEICLARKHDLISEIPVRTAKKPRRVEELTVCILECGDRVGIRKRAPQGLLASLYELPNAEGILGQEKLADAFGFAPQEAVSIEPLPPAKHVFSHVEWHMAGYRIRLESRIPPGYIQVKKDELRKDYALPGAFGAYAKLIR